VNIRKLVDKCSRDIELVYNSKSKNVALVIVVVKYKLNKLNKLNLVVTNLCCIIA